MLLVQYHQDNDKYHTSDFNITVSSCRSPNLSYKGLVFNAFIFRCCHKVSSTTHLYFQALNFPTDIYLYVRFEISQWCLCVSIDTVRIITCSKLCLHSFIYIILNQIRTYPFGFGTTQGARPSTFYIHTAPNYMLKLHK